MLCYSFLCYQYIFGADEMQKRRQEAPPGDLVQVVDGAQAQSPARDQGEGHVKNLLNPRSFRWTINFLNNTKHELR